MTSTGITRAASAAAASATGGEGLAAAGGVEERELTFDIGPLARWAAEAGIRLTDWAD
jgi:hypothetical protein